MFPITRPQMSENIPTMFPTGRQPFVILTLLLSLALCPLASAKPGDSDQPITIEADEATIDEKKGMSTYSGHVLLRQGGIRINASQLIVYSSDGKLDRLVATGTPVIYVQQGEADKGDIVGEAQKMEYFANDGQLVLLDNAKLEQGRNRFTGNRIAYDTQREVVTAAVSKTGKERVQVTIHPRPKTTDPEE